MTDCPIYRQRPMRLAGLVGGYKVVSGGYWFGICPDCGAKIDQGEGYIIGGYKAPTRKNAKDALHRHRVREHGLGQEGRREVAGT